MAVIKMAPDGQLVAGAICRRFFWGLVFICFPMFSSAIFAAPADYAPQKTESSTKSGVEEELPKPEDVTLITADGLRSVLTYYPGPKGKQSVPVVLLHAWKRNRTDYTKDLAPFLQSKGCAVLAPDLRGHGDSTRLINALGKEETLNAAAMPQNQFALMVTQDMMAVKDYLWDRNNAGQLNLDKLCVVGAEMGASIALDFALHDAEGYEQRTSYYGPLQLGRFVKALVLISPEMSFKGMSLRPALSNPVVRGDISILIFVGKNDERALKEADNVYNIFKRDHPMPVADKKAEQQTLFKRELDTNLQGANIFAEKKLKADEILAAFINLRLEKSEASRAWIWKERKLPHQ